MTLPIDGAYKTRDIEGVNFVMVLFSINPGDHRIFMLDVTTHSIRDASTLTFE